MKIPPHSLSLSLLSLSLFLSLSLSDSFSLAFTFPSATGYSCCSPQQMATAAAPCSMHAAPSANGYSCCSLLHACCSPNPMLQSIPDFLVSTCCLQQDFCRAKHCKNRAKNAPKTRKPENRLLVVPHRAKQDFYPKPLQKWGQDRFRNAVLK